MNLRQLEYLVAVVDHRTLTDAAAQLHLSQPSLSQGLTSLSAELGVVLFERVGRGLVLTAAGAALVEPARQVLRDVAVVRDSARAVGGLDSGSLDLVALPTLAADPLAPLVGAFRVRYPNVVVRVLAPETADAVEAHVLDGRAELGLAELPVSASLTSTTVVEQELVLAQPAGRATRALRIDELADVPLVTSPQGTSTRRLLDEAFTAVGLRPRIAVETEQRDAIVPLVLAGAGVAIVPRNVAERAEREGAAIARLRPPLRRTIGLVARPGPRSPAAQAFRALVAPRSSRA